MSDFSPTAPTLLADIESLRAYVSELEHALARRTRELQELSAIATEINSQPDLPTLLNAIVEKAAGLLGAHMGGLYLLLPDGETLELVVTYHLPGNYQGATIKVGEGLSGKIAQSGQVMMVPDYHTWEGRAPIFADDPFHRVIGVPLKVRDQIIGVINITDDQRVGDFSDDEIRLVSLFADQAALAIQNARLFEASQRELAERAKAVRIQSALYRISEAVHTTTHLDELFRSIHAIVNEFMPARNFYIALHDAATDLLSLVYFVDERDTWIPPYPPGKSLTAHVLRAGEPLLATPEVFEDLVARGEVELIGEPSVDWLGVPLKVHGRPIGVMTVQMYTEGERLTEDDKDMLVFVSDQVAMAIERKRAEESLRESERQYRDLFTAARRQTQELSLLDRVRTALTRELDLSTVFRVVVDAITDTVGYTLVSVYMRHGDTLILQHQVGYKQIPSEIPIQTGVCGRVVRTGEPVLLENAHSDPAFIEAVDDIVSEACVPLFDAGQVVGVLNVESRQGVQLSARDLQLMMALSEQMGIAISRARLYTEAHDNAARLRTAIESLPFDFWVCDQDGRYVLQNSTSIAHWGAHLGQRPEDVTEMDHQIQAHWQDNHRRAFAGEVVRGEVEYVHGDERHVYHEIIAPIWDGGQVRGILGANIDVTDRKRAEEVLHQAQKTESLGILAGGIAHDFNNLLVAMLGQASVALAKLPSDTAARSHVEQVVKAAERAADLTRQMLAYSGRGQFEIGPINLNKLIRENLHLFEVATPKNVQLRSELAEALPFIDGDVGQLQQVIMNLIINAGESIGARPGVVSVVTYAGDIDTEDMAWTRYTSQPLTPGRHVVLEVRDNGSGMSADTLSRMFDPFFTTKFTGRGLGLAAVLGIVRQHRGGLQVETGLGVGTTFRLAFPITSSERPPSAEREIVQEVNVADQVILVIDDEEPVRTAVTDILELAGLSVLTAANGAEGVAAYRALHTTIGLVLLDLSMPGLSGDEVFQRLREIDPDVRVILSSGYDEQEVARRFGGQGYTAFIQKPYDDVTLLNVIKRHLS